MRPMSASHECITNYVSTWIIFYIEMHWFISQKFCVLDNLFDFKSHLKTMSSKKIWYCG